MRLVEGLLRQWQHHTCKHRWVRARWEDGSYGLRCSQCMQPYGRTWNDLIATPAPGEAPAPRQSMEVVAGTPKLGNFHRAA